MAETSTEEAQKKFNVIIAVDLSNCAEQAFDCKYV
jgi:hypothetical protein